MDRREFVQSGPAAVAGMLLLRPRAVFGYEANSAVRLGLLGCGNRGSSVAASFARNTTAQVAALGDLFADNLATGRSNFEKLNASLGHPAIDSKLLFRGPRAFEQLAQAREVDLVQISTPPFFHVQHLEAAVAAGKHVYCEKPVGIDVQQAKQALEIAKRVKPTQSVDVGFQCRNAPPIAAIASRIKEGSLGKIGAVSGNYNAPASTEKNRGVLHESGRPGDWLERKMVDRNPCPIVASASSGDQHPGGGRIAGLVIPQAVVGDVGDLDERRRAGDQARLLHDQ